MIDTITRIIEDNVSYAYCDNCEYDMDDEHCDDCHRKYMNWKLSHDTAFEIADKIIKTLEDF